MLQKTRSHCQSFGCNWAQADVDVMQAAPRNQARVSDNLSDNFKNSVYPSPLFSSNSVTGNYTDTVKIQFKNIAQHGVHKMKRRVLAKAEKQICSNCEFYEVSLQLFNDR